MLKPCRFLLLLAGLLGLGGCPNTPDCFDDGVGEAGNPFTSVIVVGESVRLRVSPTQHNVCADEGDVPVPESLSVEISDPDNQPVENQATLGTPSSSNATVRFTASKQGRYHVLAAFAPVGGIQQFDLYAAKDRSAEAPSQALPTTKCGALERTQHGGWVCDSDFWRDGVRVRQFTGFRLAISGDVVWAVNSTQIQRWVDTGTQLQLTASAAQGYGSASFLLASDDELVALHGAAIARVIFDGLTVVSTGSTSFPPFSGTLGPETLSALLLRTGDQLALVSGAPNPTSSSTFIKVCPYQLQQGTFVRTSADCQFLSGDVVGFEPNALWLASRVFSNSPFANDVRRLTWTGTVLGEQASLPLGDGFRLTVRSPETRSTIIPIIQPLSVLSSTVLLATVPVYSAERRSLLLEVLDTTVTDPDASANLLWGTPSGGGSQGVRIRTRPSTP